MIMSKLMPKRINWYLAACMLLGLSMFHLISGGESTPAHAQTLPGIEVKMSLFLPIAKNGVR